MPAVTVQANTSGVAAWTPVSGSAFRGLLTGLKWDNRSLNQIKLDMLDCFTTDPSKTCAAGATQGAEDFFTPTASGNVRFQLTIPVGEAGSLGKRDLEDITFLGKAVVRGSVTTSDCVVTVQYRRI